MAFNQIAPVVFESVSACTATNSVELGTRTTVSGVDYIYVFNGSTAAQISQGMPAVLNGTASLASGYTVTVTNAASQAGHLKCVGVAHNATIPTAQYGWLATRGLVLCALDASAVSMNAGDQLALGIDGGFVVGAATLSTGVPLGIAINSLVTTVGTGKAYFKAPIFS